MILEPIFHTAFMCEMFTGEFYYDLFINIPAKTDRAGPTRAADSFAGQLRPIIFRQTICGMIRSCSCLLDGMKSPSKRVLINSAVIRMRMETVFLQNSSERCTHSRSVAPPDK
jgi:hypothetical protein